jgi:hypothetical protein
MRDLREMLEGEPSPTGAPARNEASALRTAFEHEHRGVSALVDAVRHEPGHGQEGTSQTRVRGRFLLGTRPAGHFERLLCLAPDGTLLVSHEDILLHERARGTRTGRDWVRECMRRCAHLGAERAVACCAGTEGGYAWAAIGFTASSPEEVLGIWQQRRHALDELVSTGRLDSGEVASWGGLLSTGEMTSVGEVLGLGREQAWRDERGALCWPGKVLLRGSRWDGLLSLHT